MDELKESVNILGEDWIQLMSSFVGQFFCGFFRTLNLLFQSQTKLQGLKTLLSDWGKLSHELRVERERECAREM